jgi:hypothetical protein
MYKKPATTRFMVRLLCLKQNAAQNPIYPKSEKSTL